MLVNMLQHAAALDNKLSEVYVSTGYRLRYIYIQVNLAMLAAGCDRSASLIDLITYR